MKSNVKDFFLVIVCLIGLYLLFQISQNGRYIIDNEDVLLDTRNGKVYYKYKKEKIVSGGPVFYWVLRFEEVK
jgi:hypothetical protein